NFSQLNFPLGLNRPYFARRRMPPGRTNSMDCSVMPPEDTEQARWFVTEVQPHRSALRAWLLARFPSLSDADDIVSESCSRVLRARELGPVGSARALLFTT